MQEDMFERLKYHSGLIAQGSWDELDDYDREAICRFGDLIVEECAKDFDKTYMAGGETVGTYIRRKFGLAK